MKTFRVEADLINREREKLMKKLIEVEMDGQSAAKQASSLREIVRKFRQVGGSYTYSCPIYIPGYIKDDRVLSNTERC